MYFHPLLSLLRNTHLTQSFCPFISWFIFFLIYESSLCTLEISPYVANTFFQFLTCLVTFIMGSFKEHKLLILI